MVSMGCTDAPILPAIHKYLLINTTLVRNKINHLNTNCGKIRQNSRLSHARSQLLLIFTSDHKSGYERKTFYIHLFLFSQSQF